VANSLVTGTSTGAGASTTDGNAMQAYGQTSASPQGTDTTQSYDGASWSSEGTGSYSTRASNQGCGDSSDPRDDFYAFGGYDPADTADRLFASNFQSGTWTNITPLPSDRTSPACMYVSATEIYAFGGHDGSSYMNDGIMYDGSSFSSATGTTNVSHYGAMGGANVTP